ncbi:hypothetical protein [Aquisphaera giovannonii]|uniref:hypothetical protein n=1 Tax=Aquisphaera giovannonii TaxID=406548 RepID=UPI001AEFB419|nr:hypothetical protein [Aquisphaera giovannonii]
MLVALVLGAVLVGTAGCDRPTQVAAGNREIITSLATAVSARNKDWLESNARLIETRHDEGRLSDAEHDALTAVVSKAMAGDWKAAEQDIYALREAQVPTAEDIRNLEQRKLAPEDRAPRNVPNAPRRGRAPSRS